MSVSPVSGISPSTQQKGQSQPITPAPAVTPFSQQLDAQTTQAAQSGGTHTHHHHPHGGASQSVTSAATAASAAGVSPAKSIASSILHLLS